MAILSVGPRQQFTTIAGAVDAASPGDTINVQVGTYTNDFTYIGKSLTLQAVGGVVKMVATMQPPNQKAMIVEGVPGVSITINGFDISGVTVGDENGAAIRYEGGNLSLSNDYFHDNQEGLLGAADPNGNITIDHSEFAFNGFPTGFAHNLYVGNINSLTVTNSYFHDAIAGHEIKSRANNNTITGNRIFDNTGTASYSVDLPNGGNANISNNEIEQGVNSDNHYIIAYGEEGSLHAGTSVLIGGNVIVNDLPNAIGVLNRTAIPLVFQNNQVWGLTPASLVTGPLAETGTTFLTARPVLDTSAHCFLAGTLIATPTGEVCVQDLAVGDVVRTIDDRLQKIVWIGEGRVCATRGRRNAATPVVVRKGALADNVPYRDLRVTKGHALYIGGMLIPVEFLVNHRSILWDDHAQEVVLYHIELETHDVLLANGAPAESYRDDGNRWLFQNANSGWNLPPQAPCAPVLTGGPMVDEIWRWLLERAGPRPGFPLTSHSDMHLLVDGHRVDASMVADGRYVFRLPVCPSEVRIVSRASAPNELGLSRDPRPLGVALRSVTLIAGPRRYLIEASDARLRDGFHGYEPDERIRWTNGNTLLPPSLFSDCRIPFDIELLISGATRYLDEGTPVAA